MSNIKNKYNFLRVSNRWWEGLSLEEKQKFKKKYEKISVANEKKKTLFQYPNMVYSEHTRISKLTGSQIRCIWRFREHK